MKEVILVDNALTIENNNLNTMTNIKEEKKKVMSEIKNKVEQAKLNLIFTELDEMNFLYLFT